MRCQQAAREKITHVLGSTFLAGPVCLTLYLWDVRCQELASFLLIALLSDVPCTDRDREIQRIRQRERERRGGNDGEMSH